MEKAKNTKKVEITKEAMVRSSRTKVGFQTPRVKFTRESE